MKRLSLLYILGYTALHILAAPAPQGQQRGCREKSQRKAWHTLTDVEKNAYLNAELCLMWKIPASTGAPAAVSRYDDLIGVHQMQSSWIHMDGWFLPFHRFYVFIHEQLLRNECGYKGTQPYWDEARDAGRFSSSVLFSSQAGFGGNGVDGSQAQAGCIRDGPFASYTLHQGPGRSNTEHCISRFINDTRSSSSNQGEIDACLAKPTYGEAWPCIENGPHRGGHNGIGGVMQNPISSPGDPLFFLHHAFLDRVWWEWQEADLDNRLADIAGNTTGIMPQSGWVAASLEDEMDVYGLLPNARIRELMDIGGDLLCYEYV